MREQFFGELQRRGLKLCEEGECERWEDKFLQFIEPSSVIAKVYDGGWQGHAYVIFEDGAEICLLEWRWGSCSGCDPYEGYEDSTNWEEEFKMQTRRFDSPGEMLDILEDSHIFMDIFEYADQKSVI